MIRLFNGDCLQILKDISSNSVDLIVCDLPFGCLETKRKQRENIPATAYGGGSSCSWDVKIDLEPFWTEIRRIRRNDHTPCLHFCTTKYGFDLYNSNPKEFRYDLVWDKGRGVSFLSANKMPMRSHEMVYVFSKAGAYYNRVDISGDYPAWSVKRDGQTTHTYGEAKKTSTSGGDGKRCVKSVVFCDGHLSRQKQQHPTAKPIELYKFLIERYCPAGGTVLDPTFGSGNSGLACKELGRNYLGIEMNKDFFTKAKKKLLPE
jgi:site-specific DNA-methyltransferase (adenine-specific)